MNPSDGMTPEFQADLVAFAQRLVRTPSLSGQEEAAIRLVEQQMLALGYDAVTVDGMGNVVGRIGSGGRALWFDSHIDTVDVTDPGAWAFPPFSGEISGGRLHGRGSVDMKGGAAASIFAGALAKRLGLAEGKTIYVSCTVFEEDCDGENLKHAFAKLGVRPGAVVICEPSDNRIVLGHKGKAQIVIRARGVSAHGSAPEKGKNAIYEMAEIIQRVEQTNARLAQRPGRKATLVMSRISSTGVSLNAVPDACEAYLDRRLVPGETEDDIRREMDALVAGKNASWEVGTLHRASWTGMPVRYEPFHLAWELDAGHELARAGIAAYGEVFGEEPGGFEFWDFSTNAVTPVSLGIPVIGFGPGEYKLAHMRDESCRVSQIIEACAFYARLIGRV